MNLPHSLETRVDPTQDSYDRFAAHYASRYYDTRALDDEMDRFLALLPPRPLVLDAGCGPGHLARYLSVHRAFAVGVDLSLPMLLEGKARHPDNPLLQADLLALPFETARFHGIWARSSLLHMTVEAHRSCLAEFARVLQPGGLLYATVRQGRGTELRRETQDEVALTRFFQFWQADEWHHALQSAGFTLHHHGVEPGDPENWLFTYAYLDDPR